MLHQSRKRCIKVENATAKLKMLHQGKNAITTGIQCEHSNSLRTKTYFRPSFLSREKFLFGEEKRPPEMGKKLLPEIRLLSQANNQFEPSIPTFNSNSRFENTIAFDSSIKC